MTHLDFLTKQLLSHCKENESFDVWVASSKTGAEVYVIGVLLQEYLETHFSEATKPTIRLVLSDDTQEKMEMSIQGVFYGDALALIAPHLLSKYFKRGVGNLKGQYKARDFLCQSIQFYQHNLANPFMIPMKFDAIFCYDKIVQQSKNEQRVVEKNQFNMIKPTGCVFLSEGDILFSLRQVAVAPCVYRFD